MIIKVISKDTGKQLTDSEILAEVNRDRSDEWTDYNINDLYNAPSEVLDWIDRAYFDVKS